ncbi:hypothetical protein T12_17064 [Trichinella patagoniensis]|uniref:Uncharacterized protein n=2 Tax=Trichinella TaxID=6333 RepID=A0A0V0ZTC4_9BILA|nr:hypothetical protein T05_15842 [Trichinella murrelli]KRY15777.1 hypothetical protein T12_17064 [Trichinella patagoniensis]
MFTSLLAWWEEIKFAFHFCKDLQRERLQKDGQQFCTFSKFTEPRDLESGEQDGWPSFSLKQIIKVNICALKPSRAAANALLERFSKKDCHTSTI